MRRYRVSARTRTEAKVGDLESDNAPVPSTKTAQALWLDGGKKHRSGRR